jgi:hypothetical protein
MGLPEDASSSGTLSPTVCRLLREQSSAPQAQRLMGKKIICVTAVNQGVYGLPQFLKLEPLSYIKSDGF